MNSVLKIPIPLDLTIAINPIVIGVQLVVSVSSNADISKLTWTIADKQPLKITSFDSGKLLVLSFLLSEVSEYNLLVSSVQVDYLGSDLLNYLVTPLTGFGEMLPPTQPASALPTLALVALLGALAVGFAVWQVDEGHYHRNPDESAEMIEM